MRGALALALLCAGGCSCGKSGGERPGANRGSLAVSYGDCSQQADSRAATEVGGDAGAAARVDYDPAFDEPLGALVGDSVVEMHGVGLGSVMCDLSATAGAGGASGGPGGEIGSGSQWGTLSQITGGLPTQCGPYYNDVGGSTLNPTRPLPVVKQGPVQVSGNLDQNIVRRYLRRSLARMRHCYEKRLTSKPRLAGTVRFEWVISADGIPLAVKVKGIGDSDLDSCLAKAIRAIHYPKPTGGGLVQVRYSLILEPPSKKRRAANVARPRRTAAIDAGLVDAAPEPAASAAPTVPAASTDAAPVQVTSPLTSISEHIEDCLHQSSDRPPGGELAVNLTVDKGGAVTAASATGSDDLALLTCIGDRAMTLTYPPSDRPVRIYRCPITFDRSGSSRR